ncbi:hypothetical protein U1Q18_019491 [Sarracenia purpurea var. burkii]
METAGEEDKVEGSYCAVLSSNTSKLINNTKGLAPLCARFEDDGKVTLAEQVYEHICAAMENGHYGLVIELPEVPPEKRRVSGWKVAVGSSIEAALGPFLLSLILVVCLLSSRRK